MRTSQKQRRPPRGLTLLPMPAIALAVMAVAALAGCGSSAAKPTDLNTVVMERAIAGSILTERHIYTLVSCPAKVPQQKGHTFTCEARLTVGKYPVHVTEVDSDGHVRYGNQAALVALDTARVQRTIEASILAQRGLHAKVRCPASVLQKKGLSFTCKASVGAKSYPFAVTQVNGHGYVKFIGR